MGQSEGLNVSGDPSHLHVAGPGGVSGTALIAVDAPVVELDVAHLCASPELGERATVGQTSDVTVDSALFRGLHVVDAAHLDADGQRGGHRAYGVLTLLVQGVNTRVLVVLVEDQAVGTGLHLERVYGHT